jgi:hypothetical protein
MNILTDPQRVHDHAQTVRHIQVAKTLIERCPETGNRFGTRKARGRCQRLLDLYALGARHPMISEGGTL